MRGPTRAVSCLVGLLLAVPGAAPAQCFPLDDLHRTTWEWVESVGGVGGGRIDPGTVGHTRQLIIDVALRTWTHTLDETLDRRENVTLTCGEVAQLGEAVVKTCDEGERPCLDQALTLSKSSPWRLHALDIGVLDGYWHVYELREAFTPVATDHPAWSTLKAAFDR